MSGINTRDQFQRIGRESSTALRDELRTGLNGAVSDITRQFGAMGQVADSTFAALPRGAAGAALGIGSIGLAAVAAGKQLYDLGAQWDSISDGITARTGKIGSELTAITDVVKDLGTVTAVPLQNLGDIAGQVSQSLNLTGQPLQEMTQTLAELTQLGRNVDIRGLGKTFQIFDVTDSRSQIDMLNELNSVSQSTGIDINQLITSLRDSGKTASQFGLSMGQAAGLLATLDEAGVDVTKTSASLSIALKNLAKDGRDPAEGLRETVSEIKRLHDAGLESDAVTVAVKNLGRGYADLLGPIEKGTLSAESLDKALSGNNSSIHDQAESVGDLSEEWTKLSNTLSTVFEPAASWVFSQVNENLQKDIINPLRDLMGLLHGVDMPQGPSGPLPPGYKPSNPLAALSGATPPTPGTSASPDPGAPGFGLNAAGQDVWGWGRPPGWGHGVGDGPKGSTAKLPDSPVLPYDTSLPAGIANLPQTAALYSAESGFLDARHKAAEKQARLNQLEQSNVATERDIQDARNEAIQATRSQNEAEARMYDAATEKAKNQADQMEQIGAQLDQDFGVSKGLAGIAENITKFLANLAFAPVFGALEAVKKSDGFDKDSGSGLLGMLGNQGAFGPQFTAAARASASGSSAASPYVVGPAGVQQGGSGAYPGDAALLANVPAGRYSQTGNADLTQGLADCSSAVEDLVNIMDGRPTGGRSMATGNAAQWLTEHGFQPGMGGPGDMRVGYNAGHMQATLPGGTPFNWGSDAAAARGGVGGTGAFDPSFTDHYYRPAGGATPTLADGSSITNPGLTNPVWSGAPGTGGISGGGGQGPLFGQGLGIGSGVDAGSGGAPGVGYDPMALLPGSSVPGQGGGNPLGGLTGGPGGAPGGGFGWGRGGAPGAPGGLGNRGAAPGQSVMGGRQFGQGLPASGGISFNGGIIGAAASMAAGAAAGAASMGAGGGAGGAAADIGMQLIGRAIGAGGQYAGNAVTGLMETFALNDSALADPGKSWLGRLGIAAAGMRPALPNTAGALGGEQNAAMAEGGKPQPPGPLTPQEASEKQAADAKGGGDGKPGDTTNITVNNQRATEDGTGRDIQASLGANQSSKQPR